MRYNLIENGKRTRFIYHNGELLYEKGEENKQSKEETSYQLGAGIEAFQRNKRTFYYHQDEQLNTALITNRKGEIKNQYQYDAFGNGLEAIEELPNRIRYTGQQYDQQTEQYYLRARYYNPIVGRFMQEDVYQGDGLNLYAYCHNNPIIYYDPSGYGKHIDYTTIPRKDWSKRELEIDRITGSPNIPTLKDDKFQQWFDGLTCDQLDELYKTQSVKDLIKGKLRGNSNTKNHEWNLVAYANKFKRFGLTADDIMKTATATKNVKFKNIEDKNTRGKHTNTSAGRYAHMELEDIIKQSESYSDYVIELRKWANKHLEGGAAKLPGYLKEGENLPDHILNEEIKQKSCKKL